MSYGQQLLKQYFGQLGAKGYKENYRPEWLNGLELDFYWENQKVAVEFNGDQHYSYTTFGSPIDQQKRDKYKLELCGKNKVKLVIFEACDLQYSYIMGKLRKVGFDIPKLRITLMMKFLKGLDRKSARYRRILIKNFGSSTAKQRGTKSREYLRKKLDKKYSIP